MKPEELSILEKDIILILNGNNREPVDMLHLKAMLYLLAKIDPELQKYIDDHGGIHIS